MAKPRSEISWIPALKQWRKRRDGKTYYLGTGRGKYDDAGFERALKKWHEIRDKLDKREETDEAFRRAVEQVDAPLSSEEADKAEKLYFQELLGKYAGSSPHSSSKYQTMAQSIEAYIATQEERYKHGLKYPNAPKDERVSPQRFIAHRYNANVMKKFWGEDELVPADEASVGRLMLSYKSHIRKELDAGTLAEATYNERIKTMRHFFGWMYDNYIITALPRKIRVICAKYKAGQSTARALSLEVIRAVWSEANSRLRCYIALALNCGFYAVDIAHLEHAHIQDGFIWVDRHKTGVPTRFKLWKITDRLLRDNRSDHARFALVAKDGGILWRIDPNNEAGKGTRWCEIENDLKALTKRKDIKNVSFSNFRDTSSTKVESIDRTLTDFFDGHKDPRQARFYIDPKAVDNDRLFASFDSAIDELDAYYGLTLEHEPDKAKAQAA